MPKPATHLMNFSDEAKVATLYRASDGMLIGEAFETATDGKGGMCRFGADPQKAQNRLFLDYTFAKMFLRKLADADASGIFLADIDTALPAAFTHAASIEEKDKTSRIVAPGGKLMALAN